MAQTRAGERQFLEEFLDDEASCCRPIDPSQLPSIQQYNRSAAGPVPQRLGERSAVTRHCVQTSMIDRDQSEVRSGQAGVDEERLEQK